jgi:hypothetical protein
VSARLGLSSQYSNNTMQPPSSPTPDEIREISELIASADKVGGKAVEFSVSRLNTCVEIGKRLNQWKKQLGHGKWDAFVSQHFPDLPKPTRSRWQKLAAAVTAGRIDPLNARGLRNAYILIGILPEAEPSAKEGKGDSVSYLLHIARALAALKGVDLAKLGSDELRMLKDRLRPIVSLFYQIDADNVNA